jgi:TPR repeat protein
MRAVSELGRKWSKVSSEDLRKAAEAGNAEAQYFFGQREWKAVVREAQSGWDWMERAQADGKGLTDADKPASENAWREVPMEDLRKAAQASDHRAQWALGKRCYQGACAHALTAFEWVRRAADQSLPYAENELAVHLLGYVGWIAITTNQAEGLKWLQRSAAHGFEPAQHKLADLLLEGRIVAPDLVKAIDYLEAAATDGCARAQYQLAQHYAAGEGEPRQADQDILSLLQKSARSGNASAMAALADMYRAGLGVQRDFMPSPMMIP